MVSSTNIMVDPGIAGFQVNLGHTSAHGPLPGGAPRGLRGRRHAGRAAHDPRASWPCSSASYYMANIIANTLRRGGLAGTRCRSWGPFSTKLFTHGRRLVLASFVAQGADLSSCPSSSSSSTTGGPGCSSAWQERWLHPGRRFVPLPVVRLSDLDGWWTHAAPDLLRPRASPSSGL
jgi:hypothetical protein